MIAYMKEWLEAQPFIPFDVVTGSGRSYRVRSHDHAGVNPRGTQVVIWLDDAAEVTLSALHITAVEKAAPQPA